MRNILGFNFLHQRGLSWIVFSFLAHLVKGHLSLRDLKGHCHWGPFICWTVQYPPKPWASACSWDKKECLRLLRQKENSSSSDVASLEGSRWPAESWREGYFWTGKSHRACQESRAIFQQQGLKLSPGKSWVSSQSHRRFLARKSWMELSTAASRLLMFCAHDWLLEGVMSATGFSRWRKVVFLCFVSECQPQKGKHRTSHEG